MINISRSSESCVLRWRPTFQVYDRSFPKVDVLFAQAPTIVAGPVEYSAYLIQWRVTVDNVHHSFFVFLQLLDAYRAY